MSNTKQSGKLEGLFASLNDRERKLAMAMLAVFAVIAFLIPLKLVQDSLDEISQETETYRQALDLLAAGAPDYLDQKREQEQNQSHKDLSDDVLDNNDLKLTSFVAEQARAVDVTITSYDEDELPFGDTKSSDGPIIIENQLRIEVREAEMDKLVSLMDRIEKSNKPVFIKRLDIREHRSRNSEGKVRAVLTVSTFVRRIKES